MANDIAPLSLILGALEAAGEPTRLRLLALLAEAEITVSELVAILGQSQPRISRHLKLLSEAGLIDRHREGAWAFFHLAQSGAVAGLARDVLRRIDPSDPQFVSDRSRLAEVRRTRAEQAARYFAEQADDWNRIRSLHVPEEQLEAAIRDIVGKQEIRSVLDLGTGTGRMLELLAARAERAVGVDLSTAMLAVARAGIDKAGFRNVQLRQGDIYALPVERDSYDLVLIHLVLHYLDDPLRALREAARTMRPGGRLIVVDFAPHTLEFLRTEHAHRRLGFSREEIEQMMRETGLENVSYRSLTPRTRDPEKLTVSLWVARDPRIISDLVPTTVSIA
ncbi:MULTISPECIES: metalloregulator ArsR/SmtB family transcription factor [unclassified Beijerinckia]|uniref:ArsR/SmtB family transcription factor n=1 Tax=unclassified Beijerinckia TaxID=2638183 RepID=UPI0008978F57|nr:MULTISPECIES: metalloregulator ArsR/SmtB family transcription factor [unclassified Beijerinckia]MDH7799585.1 ubiquinone/menaquinone biosynthesis C-methylase UbiE [Beijerinckia sp. GAS462]SEB47160.1 transcriptional regulator, ArsR family [Beijerinckia sp. 28-YEA-48]